ncbi:MAG: RsiV family protein [Bacteroidales bacterium]|nr:RsiV family protein [Bacteroidales bacterium]
MREMKILAWMVAAAMAVVVGSCGGGKNDAYFNPYRDTVMMIDGKAFGWDDQYPIGGFYLWGNDTIFDDHTMYLDSISPTRYSVNLIGKRRIFDITESECIKQMKAFNRPLEGFERYSNQYTHSQMARNGIDTITLSYTFLVDYPERDMPQSEAVRQWIISMFDAYVDLPWEPDVDLNTLYKIHKDKAIRYKGSPFDLDSLGRFAANNYFVSALDNDDPWHTMIEIVDLRTRVNNGRYLTYRDYTYSYEGGNHGYYAEDLVSFDLKNSLPIDNEYLFRPESLDQVKLCLLEVMAKDKKFSYGYEGMSTPQDVLEVFGSLENGKKIPLALEDFALPQGGLTPEGVVFSYAPYAIDCYAAGAYHFTVPYRKLEPYFTPIAHDLIFNDALHR